MSKLWAVALISVGTIAMTGAARAEDGENVLSTQSYDGEIAVSSETFTCFFTAGNPHTYIPHDTAFANLTLGEDEVPVLKHDMAGLTIEAAAKARARVIGDPLTLCPKVQAIVADAAAHGGKVAVKKVATLAIQSYPSGYAGNCQRYLRETLTVTFANGLALDSEQYKTLSSLPGGCAK